MGCTLVLQDIAVETDKQGRSRVKYDKGGGLVTVAIAIAVAACARLLSAWQGNGMGS